MIEVSHLTKKYGVHTAITDLNFSIKDRGIYGFLGPNGAGKTTTMNIITGCLAATEGSVSIDGYDIFEDSESAKKLIGYLPEQPPLYQDMTPREYLWFVAKAKGVAKNDIKEQIKYVSGVTHIDDVFDRLIKNLSKGYKQRVGIAQALLGNPKIIIMDEPTVGLDPKQIIEIRDLIKKLGEEHTVILSSHILSEVRATCDHIMIISKGELIASDTPENLEKLFTGKVTIEMMVKASESEARKALETISEITDVEYFANTDSDTARITIFTEGEKDISEDIFFVFSNIGKPILRMSTVQASLEDVFLELTELSEEDTGAEVKDETEAGEEKTDESDI